MTCPSVKNKLKIQLKKLKENKDKLFEKEVLKVKKLVKKNIKKDLKN